MPNKHDSICSSQAMVAVAQLVESRIVIPVVAGSNPVSHPNEFKAFADSTFQNLEDKIKVTLLGGFFYFYLLSSPHALRRMAIPPQKSIS